MSAVVQRFGINTKGRDFIVSDIHGAFSLVLDALKRVGFNSGTDRLFCGGDLVDRGAESARARRFLQLPYVHSVRGNHEDWWLEMYRDGPPDDLSVRTYGRNMRVEWWFETAPAERDELVGMFASLPLAIEVETARGMVGIVHGDVPRGMSWGAFIDKIEAHDENTVQTALWGRSRVSSGDESGVDGIGRVFVGHTPQFSGMRRLGNVYYVDTGAIFGLNAEDVDEGRLSMVLLTAATSDMVAKPDRDAVTALVDIRDREPPSATAFGNYIRAEQL